MTNARLLSFLPVRIGYIPRNVSDIIPLHAVRHTRDQVPHGISLFILPTAHDASIVRHHKDKPSLDSKVKSPKLQPVPRANPYSPNHDFYPQFGCVPHKVNAAAELQSEENRAQKQKGIALA
jgi:hypothetical protein